MFAVEETQAANSSRLQMTPADGRDVVEWLAQQPFCNGKVAMWGGSYAGFNQWATAKEFPTHLATIVPAAAAHPSLDYPSLNNIGMTYDMQWFTLTSGAPRKTIFLAIKNSGARNSWMLTKSTSLLNRSIRLSEIPPQIFSVSSSI